MTFFGSKYIQENIALLAAALCVVTLGFVSVSHKHVTRSELLVGSTFVNPYGIQSHSYGYGNQAAAQPHGIVSKPLLGLLET